MKRLSWFLVLGFMAFACQLQNEEVFTSDNASAANLEDYIVTGSSTNGFTFTFSIKFNGNVKDISHINFNFFDCYDEPLNRSNILSFTVNDVPYDLAKLKSGDPSCGSVANSNTTKLDEEYKKNDGEVKIVITLDTKSNGGYVYIKAGAEQSGGGCFGAYDFAYDCSHTPDPCYEYKDETAWAAGTRYVTRGNWATYTPYAPGKVNVYAGQHMLAGEATFSAVDNGWVTITIVLGEGWSLQGDGNTVKIQDYASPPSGNPSPGRFAHKGSSLTVNVPANNYYGIHLDVTRMREVECPDEE